MNFGINFGLQKSGGPVGFVYSNEVLDPSTANISNNTLPGTNTLTLIPGGFELECLGDGNETSNPDVNMNYIGGMFLNAGTDVKYTYTIEVLSGSNPIFIVNLAGKSHFGAEVAPGSYSWELNPTTSTRLSAYVSFNETIAGKVRITNLSVKTT